jgi:hypothetical protein
VPWCLGTQILAPKIFALLARQSQDALRKIASCNNSHSSASVLLGQCYPVLVLILQTTTKLLILPSYKPNVKTEFIFTF